MPTFSSSVICASRRAARSSGDSDVFSHGQSCAETGEPVLVFSIFSFLIHTRPYRMSGGTPCLHFKLQACQHGAQVSHQVEGGALQSAPTTPRQSSKPSAF